MLYAQFEQRQAVWLKVTDKPLSLLFEGIIMSTSDKCDADGALTFQREKLQIGLSS
jgi:hypothetical protein